ncbi:hypothetical protein BSU00_07410 [Tenacibaculum sp. SG-28]|nr:hypothetical protein BSU00_07410 [Tenacibaculum sp. SG-28]
MHRISVVFENKYASDKKAFKIIILKAFLILFFFFSIEIHHMYYMGTNLSATLLLKKGKTEVRTAKIRD